MSEQLATIEYPADGHYYLEGVASSTTPDRQGDTMSLECLEKLREALLSKSKSVDIDHSHEIDKTIGIVSDVKVTDGKDIASRIDGNAAGHDDGTVRISVDDRFADLPHPGEIGV